MRAAFVTLVLLLAGMAAASPPRHPGERLFAQCRSCHSLEPGKSSPAGPGLNKAVGRPVASVPGFRYSRALRTLARSEPIWTPELLDRFLADPEAVAPGTDMGFLGMRDRSERRILIDWLRRRETAGR